MGHNSHTWATGDVIPANLLNSIETDLAAAAVIADVGTAGTATGDALRAAYESHVNRTGAATGQIPVLQSDSSLALRDLSTLIDTTPITAADFGLIAPVGVRALSAPGTAQVVGNAAYPVYLDLTSTDFNDDGTVFTVDTTGDKITVAVGGIYLIDWGVGFTPTTGTTQEAYLTKNAGNALAAASGGSSGQAAGSFRLRLAAGDYVQVITYVEGAAVTIHNQSFRNWLHLERIGL